MFTRKIIAMAIAFTMMAAVCGCSQKSENVQVTSTSATESEQISTDENVVESYHIGALKGPTGMGVIKLLMEGTDGHIFSIAGSADEITPSLISGNIDMACVPANMASVLYNKTEGEIVTLAINTLGVLYIVEKGDTIGSIEDLRGKTIVAAGKGATPEYSLNYLLKQNGINPETDVNIDWKSEHTECVAALASDSASIALLPQPFVTVAQGKVEGLNIAIDLTKEWAALDNGSELITGVIVARKDIVDSNPDSVKVFLEKYAESVNYVNNNIEEASTYIGDYEIVDAEVAKQAIPYCNIVCITGKEMKEKLSGYLSSLMSENPQAVGGDLPDEDFYFDNN